MDAKQNRKKVQLQVKPLESKVTPYCCPYGYGCDGTVVMAGYGEAPWGGYTAWYDCQGQLAAVADY